MERRDALRLLASAAALSFVPTELLAILRVARAETRSGSVPRTLNPHQYQTVTRMAEIILPETDTAGATAAHVNDFIDLILTEWYEEDERKRFLAGLEQTDQQSVNRFGKAFVDLAPGQQAEIVRSLDDEMAESIARQGNEGNNSDNFFHAMKRLTLTGYFTSEAGATQELHFKIIPGHYDGCVPADEPKSGK